MPRAGRWLVATEHGADELNLQIVAAGAAVVADEAKQLGGHDHESAVSSVGIEENGRDLDPQAFNEWIGRLLQERGSDLYRYKGILALAGEDRQIVLQGVHMLLTAEAGSPWVGPRRSQLVFIGRNLDRAALIAGFRSCLR